MTRPATLNDLQPNCPYCSETRETNSGRGCGFCMKAMWSIPKKIRRRAGKDDSRSQYYKDRIRNRSLILRSEAQEQKIDRDAVTASMALINYHLALKHVLTDRCRIPVAVETAASSLPIIIRHKALKIYKDDPEGLRFEEKHRIPFFIRDSFGRRDDLPALLITLDMRAKGLADRVRAIYAET